MLHKTVPSRTNETSRRGCRGAVTPQRVFEGFYVCIYIYMVPPQRKNKVNWYFDIYSKNCTDEQGGVPNPALGPDLEFDTDDEEPAVCAMISTICCKIILECVTNWRQLQRRSPSCRASWTLSLEVTDLGSWSIGCGEKTVRRVLRQASVSRLLSSFFAVVHGESLH